jgi:bacillithiol synthase
MTSMTRWPVVTELSLTSISPSKIFTDIVEGIYPDVRRDVDDDFLLQRQSAGIPRKRLQQLVVDSMQNVELSDHQVTSLEKLGRDKSVAVVTGQQVGLFGGPFYTLLKIASTAALAADLSKQHPQADIVPIYWLEDNDHDAAEASTTFLPTSDHEYEKKTVWDGQNDRWPVEWRKVTAQEYEQIRSMTSAFDGRYADDVSQELRSIYVEGRSWADAFLATIQPFLASWGVVVVRGSIIVADNMHEMIMKTCIDEHERLRTLVTDQTQRLIDAGYHGQVHVSDVLVFGLDDEGRQKLSVGADGKVEIPSSVRSFSPTALTRPLIQDSVLPTIASVLGAAEMAYHCQISPLYHEFGIAQPMLVQRHHACVLDQRTERLLSKVDRSPDWFFAHWDEVERKAADIVVDDVEPPLPDIEALLRPWQQAAERVDPTLLGRVGATATQISSSLEALNGKIRAAAKRKNEQELQWFHDLWWAIYPFSILNERIVPLSLWVSRLGQETVRIIAERVCAGPRTILHVIGPSDLENGHDQ